MSNVEVQANLGLGGSAQQFIGAKCLGKAQLSRKLMHLDWSRLRYACIVDHSIRAVGKMHISMPTTAWQLDDMTYSYNHLCLKG